MRPSASSAVNFIFIHCAYAFLRVAHFMTTTINHATETSLILLHASDNVAVARKAIDKGALLSLPDGATADCLVRIPFGHKLAVREIAAGEPVRKFGQVIGVATQPIAPGEWVHSHNLAAGELHLDYAIASDVPPAPAAITGRTFMGYRRPDGKAGTRNYVAIISTVNCAATTSKLIASRVSRDLLDRYPNVDGVVALTHKGGCALQYGGEDHRQLARTLAGFAKHANVGAYLLLGLGCETAPASFVTETHGLVQLNGKNGDSGRGMPVMTIQEQGGIRKTTDAAVAALAELLPKANAVSPRADSCF